MNNQTLTLPIIDTHDPELTVLEILSQADAQDSSVPDGSQGPQITSAPGTTTNTNTTNTNTAAPAQPSTQLSVQPPTQQRAQRAPQPISQRSIAKTLNLSLGMTNAIIKRLVTKGWVTIHRVNPKNLQYSLTPEGTREVARRTYRYLRRTMGQVGRWKEKIQEYMEDLKAQGYTKVQLVGETDLDFILEHCAVKAGLDWEWEQRTQLDINMKEHEKRTRMVIYSKSKPSSSQNSNGTQGTHSTQNSQSTNSTIILEDLLIDAIHSGYSRSPSRNQPASLS